MTGARVELRGFGLRHPGRRSWALRSVDLTIEPGQRVLLLGASGSGKSTLLRAIAGLDDSAAQTEGSITVDGLNQASPEARRRVALVLQDPDAHLVLPRVEDDVAFGLRNRGMDASAARSRAREALRQVGLDVAPGRRVDTLSGGQRQRAALAGALAQRPDLLLLDEPTSMLDPDGATAVRRCLTAVLDGDGRTMVVVEHRSDEWRELVDRVVVLGAEGVLADGPADRVLGDRTLRARGVWVGPPDPVDATARVPAPGSAQLLMEAARVSWRYRGGSRDALHDVSLELSRARVSAITGANGSGKSTLLALLGGLRHPSSGRVVASPALRRGLRKSSPSRWRPRDLAGRVGTVFQNPEHSFIRDTVADEVAVGVRIRACGSEVQDRTEQLLTRLRLDHVAGANPFTLSGGEQRRLSVAAALAARPDVLVLDEPTFGQDPVTWAELVSLVEALRDDGAAVAMATHDRWFVAALAAEELVLVDGTHRRATAKAAP